MKTRARSRAAWILAPKIRTASSSARGVSSWASSTESRKNHASSVEASQLANSEAVPTSNAWSKLASIFSIRMKKACRPRALIFRARACASNVLPAPGSAMMRTRKSSSISCQRWGRPGPGMRKSHSRERDDIGANRRMSSTIFSVMIAIQRLRDRDSGTSARRHRPGRRGGAAHGAS